MATLPVALFAAITVIPAGVSSAQTATPWAVTGSMNYAHATSYGGDLYGGRPASGGAEVLPNGQVFVTADSTWTGGTAEVYNPATGKWAITAPMLYPVKDFATTELSDGRVLVTGGYRTDIGVFTNRTQIWSPSTGMWTEAAASPPNANGETDGEEAVTLHNGQVLLLSNGPSAYSGGAVSSDDYLYNPTTNTWTTAPSRPYATTPNTPAVVLPNGNVLVVQQGGPVVYSAACDVEPVFYEVAQLYQAATNTWKTLGTVPGGWGPHATATLLNDGTVLFAGGAGFGTNCPHPFDSSFIYTPATDTWIQVGSMSEPRFDMSAVKLADGRVLIAGGDAALPVGAACTPGQGGLQSTWRVDIYDPVSKSYTAEPTMLSPRESAVAALLPNGKVLIAGGLDTDEYLGGPSPGCTVNHELNEAELFTP